MRRQEISREHQDRLARERAERDKRRSQAGPVGVRASAFTAAAAACSCLSGRACSAQLSDVAVVVPPTSDLGRARAVRASERECCSQRLWRQRRSARPKCAWRRHTTWRPSMPCSSRRSPRLPAVDTTEAGGRCASIAHVAGALAASPEWAVTHLARTAARAAPVTSDRVRPQAWGAPLLRKLCIVAFSLRGFILYNFIVSCAAAALSGATPHKRNARVTRGRPRVAACPAAG
jgi:hypothetical protein